METGITYIDEPESKIRLTQKQFWDGNTWIPCKIYRLKISLSQNQESWMNEQFGRPNVSLPGRYWANSRAGGFVVMEERVYTWFAMKWLTK